MPGELYERERELQALDDALESACRGTGRLVVLDGPAGVGKSRLLLAAREAASERGLPVLKARGIELERGVPFGLARQLFVPALARSSAEERARLLDGPGALATPILDGGSSALGAVGEGQAGATIEGLYWLAANLATSSRGPSGPAGLVLVVDDAQWADRSSLRFLLHAVSALEEVALCLLVAVRTGEPDTPGDLLGRLHAQPGCVRLAPTVLSDPAVAAMVRAGGFPDAHHEFCRACARASGGNPFLLRELLAVLARDGVEPTAAAARHVDALLPESVVHAVLVHLGRLPPSAAALAAAVAVLDQSPLPMAAELAGLDPRAAEEAADVLIDAQLVTSAGNTLSVVHPLIAAAIRADLRPLARARTHRRAAALLEAAGADIGRIAGHLLETWPAGDPWVSAALRAAGREALLNGESASAVRLLRRALAEPPPDDERTTTLIDLASAEAADDSPEAPARLTAALAHVHRPGERAGVFLELTRLRFFKGDIAGAADAAEAGLAELDAGDPIARQLLSAYLLAATFDSRLRPALGDRLAPYLADARAGRVPADPLICAHLGARMAIAGDDSALVSPVLEQALAHHPLVDEAAHGVVLALPLVSLVIIDDLDRADAALAAAIDSPVARRSLMRITVTEHWSAVTAFRRGDLVGAHAHARRALAAFDSDDWDLYGPWIRANLAQVLLEQGNVADAREALAGNDAVDPIGRCLLLEARGRLAAALDDPAGAYGLLTEAGRSLDAMGLVNPGFVSWRAPAAIAASRLGRWDEAAALVTADLAVARRTGTERSIGVALHAAGSIAPVEEAVPLIEEAVTALEGTAASLDTARALISLGAARRRAGRRREARMPLERALDIAAHAGAEPLARRAEEELRATGSKPRRAYRTGIDALTPTERRIAELVARDRTNPQIAHELYITTKTVEWHLANVFRKLDVSTRRQLPAELVPPAR